MRVTVPHNTTREHARRLVEEKIVQLESQYGEYASDLNRTWSGDTLEFQIRARGFGGSGRVEVTETDVVIEGKLPLIAKPFEPRIKSSIEQEAERLFKV